MNFVGGFCLEFGFRERLPRENVVVPITLIKELHCGPKLAYFMSVWNFRGALFLGGTAIEYG